MSVETKGDDYQVGHLGIGKTAISRKYKEVKARLGGIEEICRSKKKDK
jgi:hypothetical protein